MERKLSKSQRSESRPPLTSRIRASFEGKRTKSEVSSPTLATNGFITQQHDPEALQKAVDNVMNGESFQNAIAANLAKILKPTIKSALDTIQPVVEAVYNHEVLLRKTSQSVENLLERLDTVTEVTEDGESVRAPATPATPRKRTASSFSVPPPNVENIKQLLDDNTAQTASKLAELSNLVDANNGKLAEVLESISGVHAHLAPTRDGLDHLKSLSEQSSTNTSVIQAQLDQLKVDVGSIIDAIGTDLGTNVRALNEQALVQDTSFLSEHSAMLDTISVHLAGLKTTSGNPGSSDNTEILQTILSNIEALKESVQTSIAASNESFAVITPQIGNVLASVEGHSVALADVKVGDQNGEILAALQQSNESHAAHAVALAGIKEKEFSSGNGSASSDPEIVTTLQAIQVEVLSLKENFGAGFATNFDNVANIGAKVDSVLTTLASHKASDPSGDILAAVQKSNESHASHGEALEGIRSISGASAGENGGSANLEPQITTILATLDSHTAALDDIKDLHASHTTAFGDIKDLHATHTTALDELKSVEGAPLVESSTSLEPQIATIVTTLESHTAALDGLQELHTSHATALEGIRSMDAPAASGNAPSLEPYLATIISTLGTHTAALDGLKSNGLQSTTEATPLTGNLGELETQIAGIAKTLMSHTTLLNEIKDDVSAEILTVLHDINGAHANQNTILSEIREADVSEEILTALHASNDSHAAHSATLADIHAAVQASNDSHASHTRILDEIKSTKSLEPAAAGEIPSGSGALDTHIESIMSTLSGHNDFHNSHAKTLAELKEAITASSEAQASHSASLVEIKDASNAANDLHASHLTALTELKAAKPAEGDSGDISALETHLTSIVSTLDGQNDTLSEIKDGTSHKEILENIASLKAIIEESRAGLDEHGSTVKDLHESTKASHSEITQALGAFALGGAAGAGAGVLASNSDDKSGEILKEVKAVRAIVEKASETTTSMATQIDINHTTVTTSITTLNDELKAEVDATGTEIATAVTLLSGDVNSIDLKSMSEAVSECGRELNALSSKLDGLDESMKETSAHVEGLKDGFHLSDKGIGQLKEHAIVAGAAVPTTATAAVVAAEEVHEPVPEISKNIEPEQHIEESPAATEEEAVAEEHAVSEVPSVQEQAEETHVVEDTVPETLDEPVHRETLHEGESEHIEVPEIEESSHNEEREAGTDLAESVLEEDPDGIPPVHDEGAHVDGHALDEELHEHLDEEPHVEELTHQNIPINEETSQDESLHEELKHDNPQEEQPIHEEIEHDISHEEQPIHEDVEDDTQHEPKPIHEKIEHEEPIHQEIEHDDLPEAEPLHEADHPTTPLDSPTPTLAEEDITPTKPSSPFIDDPQPLPAAESPLPSPTIQPEEEEEPESASTSTIASPLSPSFPGKSKKGKKDKKGKKKPWEEEEEESMSASTSTVASPMEGSFSEAGAGGKKKKGKKGKKGFVFEPEDE